MKCCGWNSYNDYRLSSGEFPASCCRDTSYSVREPQKTCTRAAISFSNGCKDSPVIRSLTGDITYTAYALILIQLVVILAACCLSRDLTSKN